MDIERALLSKALRERDLGPILHAKISPEFFEDDEHRQTFQWVIEYWNRYNKCPTAKALKSNFPSYRLIKVEEPYEFYLDEIHRRRKYGLMVEALSDAGQTLNDGPAEIE